MVHLSSGETLQKLKETYPDLLNKRFFVESCPQYFLLNEKRFQGGDGYLYTMAPPIRSEESRRLLCGLVADVYAIGTDHCPFTKAEKNHLMLRHIPLGIGGVEHAFPLLYKEFSDGIIDKMTSNTAKIQNLPDKGEITIGKDADLCLFRPDPEATIATNHSRCDYDVYQGFPAGGTVVSTILRGHFVIRDGVFAGGAGKLVSGGRRK
jgi:dihydropyrimidinase